MRNEIYTQVQRGKRIAYTRHHVGCDALSVFASNMTDYSEDDRLAAQEVIAYTADAVDALVRKGGIVTKNRMVRRGISALDIPDIVKAQLVQGPIASTLYERFHFPISPRLNLNMHGGDRVFVVSPFPKDLSIQADGFRSIQILTLEGEVLENWIGFSTMMNRVVGKYYDFRNCSPLVARATIVDNAFADAIVANR